MMEVDLIVLPKNNSNINLGMKKQITDLFESMFDDVSDNTFSVQIDDKSILVEYLISSKDKNMLFLKLNCGATPVEAAKCLDFATNKLIQGEHRKNWNIVISYDEVSQLYCCKLMPLFGEFERRTRELVYITIIKIFGIEWFDNSFSKSLQDALKGKANKSKLVENALNELIYEQLKEYLFMPFSNRNFTEVIEQDLVLEKIEEFEKEDLINVINQCRSESLWNRFFSEYKQFEDFKEKIEKLQPYRNAVMHHKRITLNEYDKVRKSLKNVNKLLIEAIEVLEDEIYTETKFVDVISAFGSLLVKVLGESIPNWVEKMKPALASLGELVVKSAMPQIKLTDAIPALSYEYKLSDQMISLGKQFQMSYATSAQLSSIANAYKDSFSNISTISDSLNLAGAKYASAISSQSQLLGVMSNFRALSNNYSFEAARVLGEQVRELNGLTKKRELVDTDDDQEESNGDED